MGIATDLVDDLVARPLTQQELRQRREAERTASNLVGTLDGQLVAPAPTPVEAPRVVREVPLQTWD
jgi:hypothetical protein